MGDQTDAVHGMLVVVVILSRLIKLTFFFSAYIVIEGGRVDDKEYMAAHGIDPAQVSRELITIFANMIFIHGFVHCDPRK